MIDMQQNDWSLMPGSALKRWAEQSNNTRCLLVTAVRYNPTVWDFYTKLLCFNSANVVYERLYFAETIEGRFI